MVRAGVAVLDITPLSGRAMAGFAVRTQPATGTHDPLTLRALALNECVIVTADLLGLDAAMCERIRRRSGLLSAALVLTATHTHGGPATLPGRAGGGEDADDLKQLEESFLAVIAMARGRRRPARLLAGVGRDPQVGRNRRHPDGPVDPTTPVLRVLREDGSVMAVLFSYGCHPVTLGPDNLLWTSDYVHYARERISDVLRDGVPIFLTGCCGDVNTGHSAASSQTLTASPERSFETARQIGHAVADAVLAAELFDCDGSLTMAEYEVELPFQRREADPAALAAQWRAEMATAEPARRSLLRHWITWAETVALTENPPPWLGRVHIASIGRLKMVFLPGEIFAQTALDLRAELSQPDVLFVVSYADGFPGYLPPRDEYHYGGYEVEEAHRFLGLPGAFAPGCAEALVKAAVW